MQPLFSCFCVHILYALVPLVVLTCAMVSGQLPLGVKRSLLCPVIQACHAEKKKSNHMIRRMLMVSESSFCPDTA